MKKIKKSRIRTAYKGFDFLLILYYVVRNRTKGVEMDANDWSFAPDFYIKENIECLNNMFGYISVFMGIYDEWARSNNIDITKMKILHGLYFGKCNKQRDVVAKYNLSRTTVSSSVKIMSSKQCGLVKVESTNKTLSLTAEGIEKAKAIENFFKQIVLKVEKSCGKNPKDMFQSFNVYANMISVYFTGKGPQNKNPHA